MTTSPLPPVKGSQRETYDGRYRLYTIEHLSFDAFPAYRDGGPASVVIDGWSTSTSSLCRVFSSPEVVAADDRKVKVSAHRDGHYVNAGTPQVEYVTTRHPLDGQSFDSQDAADRALYEAGLTAKMVYVKHAHKWAATAAHGEA